MSPGWAVRAGCQLQFAVAGDHSEQVVEVVSEAARESADGFHFLRLSDLFLGGLNVADVAVNAVHCVEFRADDYGRDQDRNIDAAAVFSATGSFEHRRSRAA